MIESMNTRNEKNRNVGFIMIPFALEFFVEKFEIKYYGDVRAQIDPLLSIIDISKLKWRKNDVLLQKKTKMNLWAGFGKKIQILQ